MPECTVPVGDRPRVVLVERQTRARELLSEVLERAGVTVVGSAGAMDEGLEAVRRCRPDIAVVDHRLPDGGGLVLCATLVLEFPAVPLLLHYGYLGPAEVRTALASGVAALVPKTVRGEPLLQAIRSHRHRRVS